MTLPPDQVRAMFDRITPAYDRMNRLMSLGMDGSWRSLAVRASGVAPGDAALDVCCGTGDLAFELARRVGPDGRVVGSDFSERMLDLAREKPVPEAAAKPIFEWADALDLPYDDGGFDAVTVGFGVRNVTDLEAGLRELRRVLRDGGRVGILEITTPRGWLRPFYRLWFDKLVPLLGKVLPGGAAYTYLPASVRRFPPPEELGALLERNGFVAVRFRLFAGGIVALHVGDAR